MNFLTQIQVSDNYYARQKFKTILLESYHDFSWDSTRTLCQLEHEQRKRKC